MKSTIDGDIACTIYGADGSIQHRHQWPSSGGEHRTDYIRAAGLTIARVRDGVVTYPHHDHLGSPVAATDASGAVSWREDRTPFGEQRQSPAGNADDIGFTGHIDDAATGLTYMQARYYDPVIGRFLSADPVGFAHGGPTYFNRYAYVGNDPINATDPTGMCTGSRITNDDGTCASTGGFTTGTSGIVQGMQIDQAVGEAFVQASGESDVSTSDTRAAGRVFRASYNGSDRQFGFRSRLGVRAAAAGALVRLTARDGNEWGTATYSLGRDYGYADPVTSGSPSYVDINVRIPYGATYLDSIHSHPGALQQGPFIGDYARSDRPLAGVNNYVVGSNRQICLITEAGYRQCTGI